MVKNETAFMEYTQTLEQINSLILVLHNFEDNIRKIKFSVTVGKIKGN